MGEKTVNGFLVVDLYCGAGVENGTLGAEENILTGGGWVVVEWW